ncbi:MAG: hypothetical protein HY554_18080 [Elusimicrobia bacterium]|nr:hypothetical protein [Elusimicrobiota bacterium]
MKAQDALPLRSWGLAAASGLALLAASSPISIWPLAWIGLAPLLSAVRRAPSARAAANLGAVAGLAFYPAALHWLLKPFGAAAVPFWFVFCLWLALFAAAYWRLVRAAPKGTRGALLQVAGAAALWTGIEYFRSEVWPLECSWLALGYSATAFSPLLQPASVVGVYGLSGAMAAANAAWVLALEGRRWPAAAAAAAAVAAGLWGAARVEESATQPPEGRRLEVALVQDESYDLDRMVRMSLGSGVRGGLWVWPEYGLTVPQGGEERMLGLLRRVLQGPASTAVLGAAIFPDDPKDSIENFAWVLSPTGRLEGRYDKSHPIPFMESRHLRPNPTPLPVRSSAGALGLLLCYDLDFEDTARRLAREGAELLVVPNLDPAQWGPWQHRQHSDMSAARAVETGLWLVRAASSGHSQIIDPAGRTLSELDFGVSGALAGEAYLRTARTPYAVLGWLLAPLCLAATAAFLIWAVGASFGMMRAPR